MVAPRHLVSFFWLACTLLSSAPRDVGAQEEPRRTQKADPYALLDQIGQALALIEREYVTPADQSALLEGALRGMVSELDPHSNYFNHADYELFEGSTQGQFGGIGVEVEFDSEQIFVIAPIEGSPAARAGIAPRDEIVAIDGEPLMGMKPVDVVGRMRGEVGSKLTLTLRRAATDELEDIELEREVIAISSVLALRMAGSVGYFRIKAFQEGTHREFIEALAELRRSGPLAGIVLDLRNNPGGLVQEAAALANEFLSGGEIFSTRHRETILKTTRARRGGAWTTGPLVVLINEFSASASEIVAGALKDRGRARVVGARSFGKGSVQTVLPLSHGGALKITTALYFTPSGRSTQARGVLPHLAVDPGYVEGPAVRVLREEDLRGHVTVEDAWPKTPGSRGAPPTNEELHLGVARTPPEDPRDGPDRALDVAHRLVLGQDVGPLQTGPATSAEDARDRAQGSAEHE